MEFQVAVVDRATTFVGTNRAVQHCVRGDTVAVTFDTEWNVVERVAALFVNRADGSRKTVEMSGNTVAIPWEVLRTAGEVYLSFIGYTGDLAQGGSRIQTKLMERPFQVQDSYGVDLVVPEATEDVLNKVLYAVSALEEAIERTNVAAARAEAAAEAIGTSTVTKAQYDHDINEIAGVLANYVGRIWYLNGVLYVPPEMAEVVGDTLRVAGVYDEETKTLWIGETDG